MATTFPWKGKEKFGLTAYQRIVVYSFIAVAIFQGMMMLLFLMFDNDFIWKTMLIFSGGISMGGYALACKSMWQVEKYEKGYKTAVWEKYGVDMDDPEAKNFMSIYYENKDELDPILKTIKPDKLKEWMEDTVKNINNYEKMPDKPEEWMEDFDG